jgi:hypothetical protein
LIKKETYISFLLSILLFVSIDISFYNHIVLGKENNNDEDSNDEDNDNGDSRDDDIIEKDDAGEDVPFILPFNAVPFP